MNNPTAARAALATAELVEPVRLVADGNEGFAVLSSRGENTPSSVTNTSKEMMDIFWEDVLALLDRNVHSSFTGNNDEDGPGPDFLTAPTWYGPFGHMDSHYNLDDLTFQLHPDRCRALIDPIYSGYLQTPRSEFARDSATMLEICAKLDATCSNGASCIYRKCFPHVDRAGPELISPVLINLLTHGVTIAAGTLDGMEGLLESVRLALGNTSHQGVKTIRPLCVCCLLALQTRSYIDCASDTTFREMTVGALKVCTLLGVPKLMNSSLPSRDFFSPYINIHASEENTFLADSSVFDRYEIVRRGLDWEVITPDSGPTSQTHPTTGAVMDKVVNRVGPSFSQ